MKISSGTMVLDKLLDGGYEPDTLNAIYGPASSGKTCSCMLAAISIARTGKKIIYIDTEGGFSTTRLIQLAPDYKEVLGKMLFLRPTNFKEQRMAFQKLRTVVDTVDVGLIIVDTIGTLYRLELKGDKITDVNRDFGKQIHLLVEIARKKAIPIVITNQVYANFEKKNEVTMVGGDILKNASKCLIELQVIGGSRRRAILRKHRSAPEKEILFDITEKGFAENKEKEEKGKGFKLF